MHNMIGKALFTEEQIAHRVQDLANQLNLKYFEKKPIFVCVLKGAAFFFVDLCRLMKCDIEMEYIAVSSYGADVKSSGVVRLIKDLDRSVEGRDVVIVEDILDTGLTLQYLKELFSARKAASVTTVVLLDKQCAHKKELATDYYGFAVGNDFVVGYGIDYNNQYRNLPYIAALEIECENREEKPL